MSKIVLPDDVKADTKRVADKIGSDYRDALRKAFGLPDDSEKNDKPKD